MISHPARSKKARVEKAKRKITSTIRRTAHLPTHNHDADYAALLNAVTASFENVGAPLFTTSAENLFDLYLKNLPAEHQIHTCVACRRFMKSFGGLVMLKRDGSQIPAMWSAPAPDFYLASFSALRSAVGRARVTGVFLSSQSEWGFAQTGPWTHFAVRNPQVYRDRLLTAGQKMAEKREDFRTVAATLADFSPKVLSEAMRLLEADALARSEKFIGPVQWLQDLHAARAAAKDQRIRDNLLWRAIATAPAGYCHPRASVIGSMIEDIAGGMDFDQVKARFDAKIHPLQYQRPQAAPSAGVLAAAEKAVEKLGIAPSLERRFARLDECHTLWLPAADKSDERRGGGVFSHLTPKNRVEVGALKIPAQTMTWEKFCRVVLPEAEAMKIALPYGSANFMALLTAVNADAPPILKWDRMEARNPVSHYVYHGGSPASQWGLSGAWGALTAVVPYPSMWGDRPQAFMGDGILMVIEGAADIRDDQGNALFPETLREELHGVRSVIEAYAKRAKIAGRENASACGLALSKGGRADYTLRVTSRGTESDYKIDRWD